MVKRYPHIGVVQIAEEAVSSNGIPTVIENSYEIVGRLEVTAGKSSAINYTAKYYCRSVDYLITVFLDSGLFPLELMEQSITGDYLPFSLDGQTLRVNGRDFEIILVSNNQTNAIIYLK